jgi:hypothetical protein
MTGAGTRFRVSFRSDRELLQLVVWADDEASALREGRLFLEWAEQTSLSGLEGLVDRVDGPAGPDDLGVAEDPAGVTYRRFISTGEELGTAFRPVPQELIRATKIMREAHAPLWERFREAMREQGFEPNNAVLLRWVDPTSSAPPEVVSMVLRDGRGLSYVDDGNFGTWRVVDIDLKGALGDRAELAFDLMDNGEL